MLRQASTDDLRAGKVSRERGHVVIAMHLYPRFLKKEVRDEYLSGLAPDEKLFNDFRAMLKKTADHNATFRLVRYEQRFALEDEALQELKRLSELAASKDVFLVCLCGPGERCHRDLLLLTAARWFGAPCEPARFAYPEFERRLAAAADRKTFKP